MGWGGRGREHLKNTFLKPLGGFRVFEIMSPLRHAPNGNKPLGGLRVSTNQDRSLETHSGQSVISQTGLCFVRLCLILEARLG